MDNNSVDIKRAARFSVAPMMDWTDRHCRYFHRKFTKNALLYTEMVSSAALVKGKAFHLLDHSKEEHPLALQLGGSDPIELSEAAALGEKFGYQEINLNVGCPSDRVQSGAFGAILMKKPKGRYNCIIVAVAHKEFLKMKEEAILSLTNDETYIIDVKGIWNKKIFSQLKHYWCL